MDNEYRYAIGSDVGGTNVRVALVRSDGQVLKLIKRRQVISDKVDMNERVALLTEMIQELLAAPETQGLHVEGVGVGSSGIISLDGEIVGHSRERDPNFVSVPIKAMLEDALNHRLPVFVDNDSKAAAWGEYLFGAGQGTRDMICLTIGTGIGGGIILNGQLLHGAHGYAGHLGFVSVDRHGPRSLAGITGCVEDYASGTGIANAARAALRAGQASRLLEMANGNIDAVSSDMVFDANEAGDALAGEVIRNAAAALGIAVGTLVNIFNPDLVVIGGGVGERGDVFLQPVRVVARENMLRPECETPIKTAALGNLAGVSGSAALTGFAGKSH